MFVRQELACLPWAGWDLIELERFVIRLMGWRVRRWDLFLDESCAREQPGRPGPLCLAALAAAPVNVFLLKLPEWNQTVFVFSVRTSAESPASFWFYLGLNIYKSLSPGHFEPLPLTSELRSFKELLAPSSWYAEESWWSIDVIALWGQSRSPSSLRHFYCFTDMKKSDQSETNWRKYREKSKGRKFKVW